MSLYMQSLGFKPIETAPKDRCVVVASDGIPAYPFMGEWHETKEKWGFARISRLTGERIEPDTVDPQPKLWRELTPAEYHTALIARAGNNSR